MLKVHHLLGLKEPKRGDVGLELEVEGLAPLPHVEEKTWRTKRDNSLRGHGNEYYSKCPISVNETLFERIKYLSDKLREPQHRVLENSYRTSFHVHCNVTHFTPKQVWTAATLYWLLEGPLAEYSGEDRKGNLFCLRLADAERAIEYIMRDLRGNTPFENLRSDRIRYMGQNLCALPTFGSLEYRTMRGTLDPLTLATWVQSLHQMVTVGRVGFSDPKAVLDFYYRNGPSALINNTFPNQQFTGVLCAYPNWEEQLEDNAGSLCELAYGIDWTAWEERINKANKHLWDPQPQRSYWDQANLVDLPPGVRIEGWNLADNGNVQFRVNQDPIPQDPNRW